MVAAMDIIGHIRQTIMDEIALAMMNGLSSGLTKRKASIFAPLPAMKNSRTAPNGHMIISS